MNKKLLYLLMPCVITLIVVGCIYNKIETYKRMRDIGDFPLNLSNKYVNKYVNNNGYTRNQYKRYHRRYNFASQQNNRNQ